MKLVIIVVIIGVFMVGVGVLIQRNATSHIQPSSSTANPTKSDPAKSDQITLAQLKAMSPDQIGKLNIKYLKTVIDQYRVNFQGIPTFPVLESQLTPDQMKAFDSVINPSGVVW